MKLRKIKKILKIFLFLKTTIKAVVLPCVDSTIQMYYESKFKDNDKTLKSPTNHTLTPLDLSSTLYFKTDFTVVDSSINRNYMTIMSIMDQNLRTASLEFFKEKDGGGLFTGNFEVRLGVSEWVEIKPDVNDPSTWYFESSRTFLSPEGLVQDNEYYFLLFEIHRDGTETEFIFTLHHPTHGTLTLTTTQTSFDSSNNCYLHLGGNFDDNKVFNINNNFQGKFYHFVTYKQYLSSRIEEVKDFQYSKVFYYNISLASTRTINFRQQSTVTKKIKEEISSTDVGNYRFDVSKSSIKDFDALPGNRNRYDYRGNYKHIKIYSIGLLKAREENLFSFGIHFELKVKDGIVEYELPVGTTFTEAENTYAIVENKRGNTVIFGFYHKLNSNFEHVGGTSGNSHTSEFYFKIYNSGIICKSDPITSLGNDLGLEWIYIIMERSIWTDTISARFKTNLMTSECTYDYLPSDVQKHSPFSNTFYFGNVNGVFNEMQPKIFYYDYGKFTQIFGGKFYDFSATKPDCLIDAELAFGNSVGRGSILKCKGSKILINEKCYDPPLTQNGCLHDGTCLYCENGYYLSSGTCLQCPSNCDTCSSATACTVCKEGFSISTGTCTSCSSSEIWSPITNSCETAVDLVVDGTNPYKFSGLTTPGNPFSNLTKVAIEAQITVGPTGTYEQENIFVKVDGDIIKSFNNISTSLGTFNSDTIILYISLGVVSKFDEIELFFNWDLHSPDETVTVNHVKASSLLLDYSLDCLIEKSDGSCLLCNKYKLLYQNNYICLNLPQEKYAIPSLIESEMRLGKCKKIEKYCWGPQPGGAVECYNPESFLLIDGACEKCLGKCDKCKGNNVLNVTENLYDCTKCVGIHGLNFFSSNSTFECLQCQLNCDECFSKFSYCEKCQLRFGLEGEISADNRTCAPCPTNCKKCYSDYRICTECDSNFYFEEVSPTEINCLPCTPNCANCDTYYEKCTQCSPGYGLKEITPDCILCEPCLPNCTTCNSFDDCTSCKSGYGLELLSSGKSNCLKCLEGCSLCSTLKICTDCEQGYTMINSICYKVCDLPNIFNLSRTECANCHHNCDECENLGLNQCKECLQGLLKTPTNCSNSLNGFCCYDCPKNCSDCSYDNRCVSCKNISHVVDKKHECQLSKKDFVENLSLKKTFIFQSYFASSSGQIVIVFTESFNMATLKDKHFIKASQNITYTSCSETQINGNSKECRITITDGNEIKDLSLTFTILEFNKVTNTDTGEEFMITKQATTVKGIYYFNNKQTTETVEGVGLVASRVSNTALGFMFLSKISSVLQMVKLTQYVEFMLYFNIQYPANLHAFIQYFSSSILDHLPNPWSSLDDPDCRPPHAFKENNAECLFLQNLGMICTMLALILFLKGGLMILAKFTSKNSKVQGVRGKKQGRKKKNCWQRANDFSKASVFLLIVDGVFFEFSVFAALQIRMNTFKTFYSLMNLVFGYCTYIYCIGFMLFTLVYTHRITSPKIKVLDSSSGFNYLMYKLPLNFLFNDLNMNNIIGRYFFFLQQLRNFLNGTIVVMFYNFPTSQIFWHITINTLYLVAIISSPPFLSKYDNVREIITSFLMVLTMLGFTTLLPDFRSESEKYNYYTIGFSMIGLFGSIFLTIVIFAIIDGIRNFVRYVKKKKEEKKKREMKKQGVIE